MYYVKYIIIEMIYLHWISGTPRYNLPLTLEYHLYLNHFVLLSFYVFSQTMYSHLVLTDEEYFKEVCETYCSTCSVSEQFHFVHCISPSIPKCISRVMVMSTETSFN